MDIIGQINITKVSAVHNATSNQAVHEGQQNDLKNHQTIRATVAEGGQDRVLLEFMGQKAWVKTKVPLNAGDELLLQLIGDDDTLYLKILNTDIVRYLQKALKHISCRPNFSELTATLEKLARNDGDLVGLEKLQRIIDEGSNKASLMSIHKIPRTLGLFVERFLAEGRDEEAVKSLKSQITRAIVDTDDQGKIEILDEASEFIEMWQLIRTKLNEEGATAMPLPYPYLERGYLLDEGDKPSGEEPGATRRKFSLNLRLSALGNLNIDLLKDSDKIYIKFKCSNSSIASLLDAAKDELLAGVGEFADKTSVGFTTGAIDPVKVLVDRLIKGEGSLLDRRV